MKYSLLTVLLIFSLTACTKALTCNQCTDCLYNSTSITTCIANQAYCYIHTTGAIIIAGCATTCVSGTNTNCCTTSNCNTIPKAAACYTCTNCLFTAVNTQACNANQPFCVIQTSGTSVSAGCSTACTIGASTSCCSSNYCNVIQKPSTCNACNNCWASTVTTETCSVSQPYCFLQTSGSNITAGCSQSCISGANTTCCSSDNCNLIPTKPPLTCNVCTNCWSSSVTSQTCSSNQSFCYTQTSGTTASAGCATSCTSGSNTTCCTSNNCNIIPTKPPLTCNACTNCWSTTPTTLTCAANSGFCYTQISGSTVTAGCAQTCTPGADVTCCNSSNCNSIPPKPITCNSCTNCWSTAATTQTCATNQPFCYVQTSGTTVIAGCAQTCTSGSSTTCCSSSNCNIIPTKPPLTCNSCSNCWFTTVGTQSCASNQPYCYTQTSGTTITAGCSTTCQSGSNTTCCTTNNCNAIPSKATACNSCTNCLFNAVSQQTCAVNQPYCFVQTSGTNLTAGCATTCVSGNGVSCCTSSYCNNIPKATQCLSCTNCWSTTPITQTCAANQPYCYVQTSGSSATAGCASTCTSGSGTTCCTSNNCNTIPPKTITCNTCTNCWSSSITSQTCATNQPFCYVQTSGSTVTAGCAGSCTSGASTTCCTTNNCNTIPTKPPLTCNSCTNCWASGASVQTCSSTQPYCYVQTSGTLVTAGCAQTCASGSNTTCCTSNNCNTIPKALTCYACTNCWFTAVSLQLCPAGQSYCYTQQSGSTVTAGCTNICQSGTNTNCCTSNNCNQIPSRATSCYGCTNCLFNPVNTQTCSTSQPYCYTQTTGTTVNAGCTDTCIPGSSVSCCTLNNCNVIPKPATCNACTNCLYNSVTTQSCSASQPYCYTQVSGTQVTAGCATSCSSGNNVQCCSSNNCNSIPPLVCHVCTDCVRNPSEIRGCPTGQRYCFKSINGAVVTKGCAATCVQGTNNKCCTTQACNHSKTLTNSKLLTLFVFFVIQLLFIF